MPNEILSAAMRAPMPVDVSAERVAEWWRDRLVAQLVQRALRVELLENYYRGDHPLPSPPQRLSGSVLAEARQAFENLSRQGVTNWVKLVADAPSERLEVAGFRFGAPGATQEADQDAWRIWQENELDADSALVHDNALQTGQSFVLVWPTLVDGERRPEITCEHSGQVIVAYEPGSRRKRAAALKLWDDDQSDLRMATLYLPGSVWKWQAQGAALHTTLYVSEGATSYVANWQRREVEGEPWPLPNELGVVSVVEFRANPSLRPSPFGGGCSEYEAVLPIQDRINKTVFDRLVTAEFQAFRQRWVVGWSPEIDEQTGLPREDQVFKASQAFVMAFGGDPTEIKVGEFPQADFKQFIDAVESDVNALAAISKTPPHYLLGAMINISGDALTAAESGLAAKTKKHARNFGESWEEVLRLALKVLDDPRASDEQSQIIWGDIEHRSWAEQVDAVLKMSSPQLAIPTVALWDMLPDHTPQDTARWLALNELAALQAPAEPEPEVPSPNGSSPPEPVNAAV